MSSTAETTGVYKASETAVKYFALLLFAGGFASAEARLNRYAVVLSDPPLAAQVVSQKELRTAASADRMQKINSAQSLIRNELARRSLTTIGAMQTLLNAVFVSATEEQAAQLRSLPGVASVHIMRPLKRQLFAALDLMNVPAAWNNIGGAQNAGLGVKIGILDTGIDQTHPAFQDNSLPTPAGFPKCMDSLGECAFTNKKIIVARSYVQALSGSDPRFDRPDDNSPRDRVGHGTALAMAAAGASNAGPAGSISGVAPKAFLGNYKIFGSPGVNNQYTDSGTVMLAMDDAVNDGMDIVTVAVGNPALCGPNNDASLCGDDVDLFTPLISNAARLGMTVVLPAGNDGDSGYRLPVLNSINSPGTAAAAITVGASGNTHQFSQSVQVIRPAGTGRINALFGNGPKPNAPLTAPLRDVSKLGDNGLACSPLTSGSLNGAIALILRGDCLRDTKVNNAQKAGAVGVIIYQIDNVNGIFPMTGMQGTGIPAVLVGNADGLALKKTAEATPDISVALDPALVSASDPDQDTVTYFSSQGPSIGDSAIKPELVAVGSGLYVATQKYDPNGDMYDPSGYTAAQGTSFAAGIVAGAAALVKQRNPQLTPAQIKSALVNTANPQVNDYDANGNVVKARVTGMGAGKLDAAAAVKTNVTAEPATISFGVITGTLPSQVLTLRNFGTGSVTLNLSVQQRDPDQNARVTLSGSSVTVNAGQSSQVTVRMTGNKPSPGIYEGVISAEGGAVPLRIPYLYQVGDGIPYTYVTLGGDGFVRPVSDPFPLKLTFKILDQYGVPVSQVPVAFQSTLGGGRIDLATPSTDELGIGQAITAYVGAQLGEQEFTAQAGGLTIYFGGTARPVPSIQSGSVVNAASLQVGQGLAPGSYISIYGSGLSDSTRVSSTPYLPLALSDVSVSFDVPANKISVPGRLQFVSDGQINVQVPWELQGQSSASMKVSIGEISTDLYTVPLQDYSPAAFEYKEAASGTLLAAALDDKFALLGSANPARKGSTVQIYANGLGPVDNQPPSGEVGPAQPLARTRVLPNVTIGGRQANVVFSGLAPGNVGLYQVNVVVPADTPSGIQPVVISANGITSKTTNLVIQ